jgi:hypothetical protein
MDSGFDRIRNKFVVLEVINVAQPIERRKLAKILRTEFTLKEMNSALRELTREGRIAKESNTYRLTKFGLSTVLPGESRELRDKHRMHSWYEIWKKTGGGVR